MVDITIYRRHDCPFSDKAEELLTAKGANYKLIQAGDDPKLREEMVQRANGRNTFPQIFIDDYHVGGYDDLAALDREGKLDQMLKGHA